MEQILSKDRIRKIKFLEKQMRKAVQEMIKTESNPTIKAAYGKVLKNLNIPINFYPRDSLMRTVFKIGDHFISSEILGEHKQDLKIVREGNLVRVIPQAELIEIPAELFFHGDKVTWKGLHTLIHEMCHDPLRNAFEFQKEVHLNPTQTEELIADLLSARISVKMGFPMEKILSLYHGRQGIYGAGFPFQKMLEEATAQKKTKEKAKITDITKLRKMQERKKERKRREMETQKKRMDLLHRRKRSA